VLLQGLLLSITPIYRRTYFHNKNTLLRKKKKVNPLYVNFVLDSHRYKLLISVTPEFIDEDGGIAIIGAADNCK